jgi:hypothetical protein
MTVQQVLDRLAQVPLDNLREFLQIWEATEYMALNYAVQNYISAHVGQHVWVMSPHLFVATGVDRVDGARIYYRTDQLDLPQNIVEFIGGPGVSAALA